VRSAVSPVEQHRQPLESSTTLPRPARPPSDPSRTTREISPASMFTSARSLTAAATRKLAVLERMWPSSAVLPEPRKPVTSVTGRSRGLAAHACASRWQKRLMRASSSAAADADDVFMPRLLMGTRPQEGRRSRPPGRRPRPSAAGPPHLLAVLCCYGPGTHTGSEGSVHVMKY
jgi:hypothetical protein